MSTTGLESFSLRPEKFSKDFLSVVVVYVFSSLPKIPNGIQK